MSNNFQQLVANMADDIRHNAIEKPWFEREVTGNITAGHVAQHAALHAGAEALFEETDINVEPGSVWDDDHAATVWANENDPEIGPDPSQGGIQPPEVDMPEIDEPEA